MELYASLSTSVIDAYNKDDSIDFYASSSVLESYVLFRDFLSAINSENSYLIGRALFVSFFYNSVPGCSRDKNEDELLKRLFLALTKTIFAFERDKVSAAMLLFITLHLKQKKFQDIFCKCDNGNSSDIASNFSCIQSLLWYVIMDYYQHFSLGKREDEMLEGAVDAYISKHANKSGISTTSFTDISSGQNIIKRYYSNIFQDIELWSSRMS